MDMTNLGKRIREMRDRRNMSQAELAESIDVTKAAISNYENGETAPSMDNFIKIAINLNCSANELLQDYIEENDEFYFRKIIQLLANMNNENIKKVIDLITSLDNNN